MLNRRLFLSGCTALTAAACTTRAAHAFANTNLEASDNVVRWLKANAIPVATTSPGGGYGDLEFLRGTIGDARVVALGEATHGTREFFQLKHRVIEYCVAELGFTMICFEAEYGNTLAVNDYVLNGKGSAGDVVSGMVFWTWDTEEVVALVEWVRAWNTTHERKVKFYGFDMQGSTGATMHLLAYLERVSPELAAESEALLAPLASQFTQNGTSTGLSRPVADAILDRLKTVQSAFEAERAGWVSRTSALDWNLARRSAVSIEQYVRSTLNENPEDWKIGFEYRDRCMAANVHAVLEAEGPGAKALLWAHNGHMQKTRYADVRSMGTLLAAEYGAELVTVGFAFNQGGFRARGEGSLQNFIVGPAPDGFLDSVLAKTGMPLLALDLGRVPRGSAVAEWMAEKPPQRAIGAVFIPSDEREFAVPGDPSANWNVLLFVENTTAAQQNHAHKQLPPAVVGKGVNEEPANLDFAAAGAIPDHWQLVNQTLDPYTVSTVDDSALAGGKAVRLVRESGSWPWGDLRLTQSFPATPWRGRRIAFKAAIRAQAQAMGAGAYIVVRLFSKAQLTEEDSTPPLLTFQPKGPVRSSNWTDRSIVVDIPADAERIEINLVLTGSGSAWFGDLDIASTEATGAGNAGLESRSSRGALSNAKQPTLAALVRGPVLTKR